jgi:hypothetical protein
MPRAASPRHRHRRSGTRASRRRGDASHRHPLPAGSDRRHARSGHVRSGPAGRHGWPSHRAQRMKPSCRQGTRAWGRINVGVRCVAGATWTLYLPARVRIEGNYLVASRALGRGQIIAEGDYGFMRGDLTELPPNILTDPQQLDGPVGQCRAWRRTAAARGLAARAGRRAAGSDRQAVCPWRRLFRQSRWPGTGQRPSRARPCRCVPAAARWSAASRAPAARWRSSIERVKQRHSRNTARCRHTAVGAWYIHEPAAV